jgi:hypothetical protein
MPDDDREQARDHVERRLADAGLAGPAFDVDAITTDYVERMDMDRSLDALIGPGDPAERETDR